MTTDTEPRSYPPSESFRAAAHVKSLDEYRAMHRRSLEDPEGFWGEIARDFHWEKPWEAPHAHNFDRRKGKISVEWFKGGKTNLCYNALDRHLAERGDLTAILWEGNEPGVDARLTYRQLHERVCRFANALKAEGVKKGDRVAIYMPMVPELAVAMLACARIGAVHSVVFAGFSAQALADRIVDSTARVVLTADGVFRGAKPLNLKAIVDEAIELCAKHGFAVDRVVMFDNTRGKIAAPWNPARDRQWADLAAAAPAECAPEWVDAEDPLFMLYTSGSTGKPKGVLHTTAGYMIYAATTFKYVFDWRPGDVWWCTADIGWITGHSYIAYGPLLNGATTLMFEGVPTYPDAGRFWEIVDKYEVTQFYTAPTAIRALISQGDGFITRHSRKSLRLLGTVGEPINPEAWRWYNEVVGDNRCPIVDTWWQTETGGILISPLPGAWPTKPGSATLPFFGVEPVVLDDAGKELEGECKGYLALKRPWPGMMRTVYGDHERFEEVYFKRFNGYYFTGDGCRRDKDGYYWITGRVDDVINVSGHRIGTAEIESALVLHPSVAEAAVVGYPHPIKGQGIYAFVTLKADAAYDPAMKKELVALVRKEIGAIAAPDEIHWAPGLPKTRSGKIMRRILRKIAARDTSELGDITTLADPSVIDKLLENA